MPLILKYTYMQQTDSIETRCTCTSTHTKEKPVFHYTRHFNYYVFLSKKIPQLFSMFSGRTDRIGRGKSYFNREMRFIVVHLLNTNAKSSVD